MARHEPRRLSLALRHHSPPKAVAVARRRRSARRGYVHRPRGTAGDGGRPALHRALPSSSRGQGDLGAERPGGADAPAERPRPSGAGIGLAESIYLGEEGRVRRTEQIVLVGQVPIEGSTVKWALTRMEG